MKKEIAEKLRRGIDFDCWKENMNFLGQMRSANRISILAFTFIVQNDNYQESSIYKAFPNDVVFSRLLHSKCLFYKEKLIFIPGVRKNIHFCNYIINKFTAIPIYKDHGCENGAVIIENQLVVIPFLYDKTFPVIKVDLKTKTVQKRLKQLQLEEKRIQQFAKRIMIRGDAVWFSNCGTSKSYSINLESGESVCYKTNISNMFGLF